jgi:ABC-type multidrug transport system ATPase subunit
MSDDRSSEESDPTSFQARANDVRALVQQGEIDLSVRRLLDLARDFAPTRELRNESIALSAKHNQLKADERRHGASPEGSRERDRLTTRILELTDAISDVQSRPRRPPHSPLAVEDDASPGPERLSGIERAKRDFRTRQRAASHDTNADTPVCCCDKLTKTFYGGPVFSLREIFLNLRIGRVCGVVGANGHGKTTLLRIVAGELRHTSGELTYPLLAPSGEIDWMVVKSKIAYVRQPPSRWSRLTLETQLRYTAALFGCTGAMNTDEVEFMLHRLGLTRYRDVEWDKLSAGFRLRSAIANALLSFPKLLILDEPFANLDINARQLFLEDLRDLTNAREYPFAVIATSQHLHEIESIADDILVLQDGSPTFCGPKESLGRERTMRPLRLSLY